MPSVFAYRLMERLFLACALGASGLAALKLTISSPAQWILSLAFLLGYALVSGVRLSPTAISSRLSEPEKRVELVLFFVPWLLLCLAVGIAGMLNEGQGLQAIPKFTVLFATLVFLILVRPAEALVVTALQWLAVASLSALLILWWGGAQSWLDFVPDRYGWAWAPPGIFWKAGIYLLPVVCWWIINMRHSFATRWGWLLVCAAILGLDGSRTASLLALVIWLAVTGLGLARYGLRRSIIKRGVILALVMMVSIGGINPSSINPLFHIYSDLGHFVAGPSVGREIGEDSIRSAMLIDGLEGVADHFPMGGGLGSTVTQTESMSEPMVVHVTYLQLLADTGLIGLVGYLGIFLVPLFYAARRLSQAAEPWACFDEMVLPLGIVGIYIFGGLLHPVSTELSEWLVVLVGIAMLAPESLALPRGRTQ